MEDVRRPLEGKTAVITGASGGIGFEIAALFARSGSNIIACARSGGSGFEERLGAISEEEGVEARMVCFDMSAEDSVRDGIREIKALKAPVDILVNNAGVGHLALLPMVSMEDMRRVFQINYFAQVQVTQGLHRALAKSGGCVINIASAAGIDGEAGNAVYGATKASMILFTKVLAREMAPYGVRVNAVAPGLVDTAFAEAMGEKARESMTESSLMRRLGTPQEVARVALFLASGESSFVNGQVIRVDGGM